MTPARAPQNLCGMPYGISDDDVVYCGLHAGHAGPHMFIFWWTEDGNDWPAKDQS